MKIVRSVPTLRRAVSEARLAGKSIGFVPTMGALHEGHLFLVRASTARCDFSVVSIFVNPLQFGKNEDLDKYPRRLKDDARLVQSCGADLVFAPDSPSFYNPDHQTFVYNHPLEKLYCGQVRPGHFRGVLTVVAKLFHAVEPHRVFFGKKDYQQAFLIRRMITDLNWNIRMHALPTKREADGLAMSSRNAYMKKEERQRSAGLYRALKEAKVLRKAGETSASKLSVKVRTSLAKISKCRVQYVEVVSRKTLLPVEKTTEPCCVLLACVFGKTRLIDNIEI